MPPLGPDQRVEAGILINILIGLRLDRVRAFMDRFELPRSGTRAELHERATAAVAGGIVTVNDLVDYLDEVEPWGRQHVILFEAEASAASGLRSDDAIRRRATAANLGDLLERRRRQVLPQELALSAIRANDGIVEVVAVERREYDVREPEYDHLETSETGETFVMKAYRHVVTRGLVTLRWDTATRAAAIHISEGFGRYDYDATAVRLGGLIAGFVDLDRFERLELGRAISRLHDAERTGTPEVRSHRVGYQSKGGRTVDATSPSLNISVVGERVVDEAMTGIAADSTGRIGNFFWLPETGPNVNVNPLTDSRGLHVVVIAPAGRVHFMVPSDGQSVSYVLQRIRALS